MKINSIKLVLAVVAVLCMAPQASAQKVLTLEDAVNNARRIIPVKNPARISWNEEGMPYEATAAPMGPRQGGMAMGTKNAQETYALQFTNSKKVWRMNTRGDYYLVDVKTGDKRKLGKDFPESSLMFAKFSPDGTRVAYVSGNNIYMEYCDPAENASNGVVALTTSGNDTIVNGTFDWVYEEEFSCRDGFRWSADSKYIVFWNSNTAGTGWFNIINNVDSIYPTIQRFPYPKAGTTNSAVKVGYIDVASKSTTWFPIPGDERNNYLPRMEFVPGTDRLMIQQMNRAQNHNKVWSVDLADGDISDLHILCEDKDDAWVETNDNIHFLQGNKFFTFTSERDGYRHIYKVSADGQKWTCITPGNFDVVREVCIDEKRGWIYWMGSEFNATQRYLYRSRLDGKGKSENISLSMNRPELKRVEGQYSYTMGPNMDYAVERFTNAETAPQTRIVRMDKKGKWSVEKLLEDNHEAVETFKSYGLNFKEFAKAKSGKWDLDAWIIKPKDFDPNKKYPVIMYVYGEPASATVQDSWDSSLFWQYLATQGYVIVSIDGRGTAAPRGREWRKCIYGEVGVAASEDQAQGIQDLCRQFPWMDETRIGITGWSGGGAQTLNSIFRYPKVFKTGIAIAFVADERLYDTIYQERYMNTPQANPDGYFRGSPINFVDGLEGNLLLVHGTGDDNVHYQSTEMLVNKLIEKGKIFYQLSYPMRTHSISEGRGTSLHLRKQLVDFWKKNL